MNLNISFSAPNKLSGMPKNTPLLLALSGGADSVCLFWLLLDYSRKNNTPLSVAHVNHCIRGDEADGDMEFCRNLAESQGIPFYVLKEDVPSLAKKSGRGIEEEARLVRYSFFKKIMAENRIPLLATAHNATDNVETVIFNLARGSGLRGLCGIPETREFGEGKIIRPLLKAEKSEILEFCKINGFSFVTDKTNANTVYSRNRIRLNVIPELLMINENAVKSMERAAKIISEADEFIENTAMRFIAENGRKIPLDALNILDTAVSSRVISILTRDFFSAEEIHLRGISDLAKKAVPHSSLTLPKGSVAVLEDNCLIIKMASDKREPLCYNTKLSFGENTISPNNLTIVVENTKNSAINHKTLQNIYKNSTTALICSDKILDGVFARNRQDGDMILSGGMRKKLKKLFCEKKIPLELRASLPLIYSGDEILWVPYVTLRDGVSDKKSDIKITIYHNF